ncbi:hypothetical protein [Sanyastnella coralliicola]|uniref:hypothetical protein n=1 Tax=Sanyastnella coralliicola TaxID=3069118 RepID=UPI0027BA61B1|nr:hypothetical protein [Longitalea sp. SCSIO 12813]
MDHETQGDTFTNDASLKMNNMNRLISLALLKLTLIFSSCSSDVELEDYLDLSVAFNLTINTIDSESGLTESQSETLEVNSEKWSKLIEWAENNKKGWSSSPATHIGDVYISQGGFRLIHTKGSTGVTIAFNDKEGNPKQYVNVVEKGELNFLFE